MDPSDGHDPSNETDYPTEQTPFLRKGPHPPPKPPFTPKPTSQQLWPTLLTVASLALLFNMGMHISAAPSLAILQGIICRNYYEKGVTDGLGPGGLGGSGGGGGGGGLSFEDDRCKIGPVQSEVAEVSAWKDVFEILPAVALAIPWGVLTDRIGRKKVLLLALFGLLLNEAWARLVYRFSDIFPVRAVWFGGLFQAIGAGSTSFASIAYVLVADVCPAEKRSTAFGYLLASTIISRLIFVPVGGYLISIDVWLAMWIGYLVEVLGFVVAAVFVKETLPVAAASDPSSPSQSEPLTGADNTDSSTTDSTKKPQTVKEHVEHYLEKAKEAGTWMLQNPKIVLLLICFWLYMMGEQAEMLLMIQYASKRLGWSFGKASLLPSLGALTNLLTLIILLPFLSVLLSPSSPYFPSLPSLRMSEPRKDTLLAQVFATFLTLGCFLIAVPIPHFSFLASGEVLYSAGAAFVCTYGAASVGRPVAAGLFGAGLRLGEGDKNGDGMAWMGLPFAVSGLMFGVIVGVVGFGGFGREVVRETMVGEEEGLGVDGEGEEGVRERYRD
ncbi:hypothetical protein SMACR_04836 [Sordaria macrospora]|uniref:MFS general substrate transporter n=1 Tax=Sordaria macrospora TaxID=5147 RepID=A0A8S8ZWN7_SORMA|nr:hypothetical protein SMACR_04836 [Sordaria macrospora]WPJ59412.1 hypothetical protein SMAC4_04836 [Sordaria macrospora]